MLINQNECNNPSLINKSFLSVNSASKAPLEMKMSVCVKHKDKVSYTVKHKKLWSEQPNTYKPFTALSSNNACYFNVRACHM